MKKIIVGLIAIFICLTSNKSESSASMQLYISDDCKNCKLVMLVGRKLIDDLKSQKELEIINVTDLKTDLPALPALVDNKKVIIGTGLIRYLAEKTGTKFSQREYLLLNDCPECPKVKNTFLLKLKEKILSMKDMSVIWI